jgi:hypothetical protein
MELSMSNSTNVFTAWFAEYVRPALATAQGKRIPFKILILIDNAPGHPRALMDRLEIDVVFLPSCTIPKSKCSDFFQSYYLRNAF